MVMVSSGAVLQAHWYYSSFNEAMSESYRVKLFLRWAVFLELSVHFVSEFHYCAK